MELPELYHSMEHRWTRGADGVIREIGVYEELYPAIQRGEWKIQPSDVFVVSYPKSGTAWTMNIVGRIMSHGDDAMYDKLVADSQCPDILLGMSTQQRIDKLNFPTKNERRLFISHAWPQYLPPMAFEQNCKIIYIMRNPKDAAVSWYHFHRAWRWTGQIAKDWNFNQFFPHFVDNDVAFGNWFDHISKWWKHRDDKNILFIKYEDVVRDRKKFVNRIAGFLDINLTDEEADTVAEATSFEAMRKYVDSKMDALADDWNTPTDGKAPVDSREVTVDLNVSHFIRKGKIGDWKNYFTVSESEKFDKIYGEKIKDMPGLALDFE